MRNWDGRDESGTDTGCEWEKDWEDVRLVSKHLGIPCRMVRVRPPIHLKCIHRGTLKGRSHERVLEQCVPAFLESVGSWWYPEPRCMVQQVRFLCTAQYGPVLNLFLREVKFGALMNHLAKDGEWLATGMFPRLLLPFFGLTGMT